MPDVTNNKTHPQRLERSRVGLNPSKEGVMQVSHDTDWNEKVQRGRALVSEINDRKWELGDLANEVAPASSVGVGNDHLIERFADEIGVSPRTLREYRRVSAAWPNATRVAFQTHTTHKTLAGHPDRHAIIAEQVWTYNSLSERLGRLPNPSRQKVDYTTGEIMDAIKADPKVATAARKALDERYEEAPKPIAKPEPSVVDDGVDLVSEFRRLHIGVDRIVQLVNDGKAIVPDATRDAILREVKWLRTALGYIEDGVQSNDLASEVSRFLQEQS